MPAMRIAAITAGAAGTFCGSCLHDNTLAAALTRLGHDVALLPTYTPIRTDEPDVSSHRVFLGGINAYLDQKRLTRWRPRFLRWLLDRPALIKFATKLSPLPNYDELGELALSVLRGEHGHQRAAFSQLHDWLAGEYRPQIVTITNVLISAIAPAVKSRLRVPILAYLQGDDVFLDALKPDHRRDAIELIRANAANIDGFIAPSRDYAGHMSAYLGIPRERIEVVPLGISLAGHATSTAPKSPGPPVIGYFARIAPEKGLHVLVDAFIRLRKKESATQPRLRISGWLGPHQREYLMNERKKLADAGLEREFECVESPGLADKVRFLQSLDVFSVPAVFREPKGLYVLEALAHGVPVVQPSHGSFPELLEATGGGRLVPSEDPAALADALGELLADEAQRRKLGEAGRAAVAREFTDEVMARRTAEHYRRFVNQK
jgi:glycosyltransferase involved in cell wall biosynthesis